MNKIKYQVKSFLGSEEGVVLRGPIATLDDAKKIRKEELSKYFGNTALNKKGIRVVKITYKEEVL